MRTKGWRYRSRVRKCPSMTFQNWAPPHLGQLQLASVDPLPFLSSGIPFLISVELKSQEVPKSGELKAIQICLWV